MTRMIYSDNVFHKELVHGELSTSLSNTYWYDNVLCGVASGDVEVYSLGIPGALGSEFSFYYRDWESKLASTDKGNKLLAIALSADGGWGHANNRCFTPISSDDNEEIVTE